MAYVTFGQPTTDFPRATRTVAAVLNTIGAMMRSEGMRGNVRALSPGEREDIGLSLADMRRIG